MDVTGTRILKMLDGFGLLSQQRTTEIDDSLHVCFPFKKQCHVPINETLTDIVIKPYNLHITLFLSPLVANILIIPLKSLAIAPLNLN